MQAVQAVECWKLPDAFTVLAAQTTPVPKLNRNPQLGIDTVQSNQPTIPTQILPIFTTSTRNFKAI